MFVKICGTTNEDDALLAVAMGADAVGFVFATSPRQIAPQVAADIAKRLPFETITVGVFRDEAPQRVVEVAQRAGVRAVQLSGHENAETARWIGERVPMLIQGFSAGDPRVRQAADYEADAILLDAPHPGSGKVFDWAFASEVPVGQQLIIAGGLTTDNVAAAIARTKPWGVDVVTGVERGPGQKDPVKLREFIAAAKAAAPAGYEPRTEAPYDWQDE
ncbi:MAG: phosphoribosylanthranilate isomerase [Acidimicrobiales bacterium]